MNRKRWTTALASGAAASVLLGAAAWACVSGPAVNLSTATAKPGDVITLNGAGFRQPHPVDLRMDELSGPIIATLPAPGSDRIVSGTFTVPASATPGHHVLILTQTGPDGKLSQMPIRALFTVVGSTGQAPILGAPISQIENRPVGLVEADNSVSAGTLLLVALGVAGVGMFAVGMAVLIAGRRPAAAQPEAQAVRR